MDNICRVCKEEVKTLLKDKEFKNANGNKVTVFNVPHESCSCYVEQFSMKNGLIIENFIKIFTMDTSISFDDIITKSGEISVEDIINTQRTIIKQ